MKFQDPGMNQSVFHGSCHVRVLLSLLKVLLTGQFIGVFFTPFTTIGLGAHLCVCLCFFSRRSHGHLAQLYQVTCLCQGLPVNFLLGKGGGLKGNVGTCFFAIWLYIYIYVYVYILLLYIYIYVCVCVI